ncbi:PPK2 family polyphosphate kinase [Aeromicrobium sp.]|uniref:PPK2 family polyphosphate kinase n=1 Tax=Aeromicrobium sp. TaxID=1871063 RepID=UPI003C5CF49D
MASSLRDQLSSVSSLAEVDSRSTPGFDGGKKHAKKALASLGDELADLQRRLYANGVGDDQDPRSMLLVLQGMDTSGKGGVIRRAVGLVDPLGLRITSFKKPTTEELDHDFLWRIEKGLPQSGVIGVFDRSHYEDVLICRVRELAPPDEIERRYGAINDFEQAYVDGGGTIVKCMLHISADDQKKRLGARLEDPAKHWKYNPADLDERARWSEYQRAYEVALERCSTEAAPWFVVPSGRKWYRNWAVATLMLEHLRELDLTWPEPDFDIEAEKTRLAAG